jgi:hypothetical protein
MTTTADDLAAVRVEMFDTAVAARKLGFIEDHQLDDPKAIADGRRRVTRLIQHRLLRARRGARGYMVPESAIREYLDGADDPIQHPDSIAV